jgi:hypothetical protein
MGGSTFAQIADESGTIQIFLSKKDLGADVYKRFVDLTDLGDIVGVQGYAFRTRTGEPTVFVQSWQMLSKALTPPPNKGEGGHADRRRVAPAPALRRPAGERRGPRNLSRASPPDQRDSPLHGRARLSGG